MNTALAIIDIMLAVTSVFGLLTTAAMYIFFWKKGQFTVSEIYDMLMMSIVLSCFSKNWLTAANWALAGLGFGILSYYNHFWFINVSVVACVGYLLIVGFLWKVVHNKKKAAPAV